MAPQDYDLKKREGDFVVNLPRNGLPGPLAAQNFPLEDRQTFWDAYVRAATNGMTCCYGVMFYVVWVFAGWPCFGCYECCSRQPNARKAVEALVRETNQQSAFAQRGLHCWLSQGRFPGPAICLRYRPELVSSLASRRTSGGAHRSRTSSAPVV